jgi:hypothetical protein
MNAENNFWPRMAMNVQPFLKGLMPKPLRLKQSMAERARIERARQVKHALATLDRYSVLNAELAPDEVSEEFVVVSLRRPFENAPRRAVLDVQRLLDQAA